MFNETKPQMFNVFREFDKIAEELMHAAEKFRNADERYDGNLVDGNLSDEKVEEGAMCGKPSEKSMLRKIWDGIYVGSGQVIGGIVEGFDSLDDTVTKENIKYAIGHPLETASTAWNTFSDSFMNDVWHGDAESIAKWGTNTFMDVGLGWAGDKGISKVGKITTLGEGVNLSKFSEGISSVSNQLPLKERFAFAGTSGFGSNQIKTFEALQEARDTFIFSETGGRSRVKGVQEVIKDYADKVLDRVDVKNEYPDSYTASKVLREELKAAGIEPPPYSNAAHHIVPWNDSRAVEAQELLKEIEIHHDSASNGVFLPYKVNEYVTTEVLHIGSHSKEYIREVTERLNSVIEMGGTQADVAEVLHKIRQDLLEGKIRLNEPKE
ncbi:MULTISPECIES: AHH domain-containing protein [Bacillus]|uniref:AHH domain-containing protein n=1 Tax=Bacillus TaxID=1386 RepID=UPI001F5A6C59|nr:MULTISPECIES: AHH domain-containing protein [Bacillus]MDA1642991.1 AHH domain-containing protein [Bacillus cereus group sp. TH163-1LC]MDA1796198.1 AHH domain-containing protein [Bacillus cereus group sp. BY8-1LC]MDA1878049.1 AHH domain-containing protein [Bacillus cereus group sp. BY10-2LC]MDV5064996.1 AHH domain-containing protein [Bacillus sp. W1]